MVDSMGYGPVAAVLLAAVTCALTVVVLAVSIAILLSWIESIALAWLAVSLPRLRPGVPFTIGLCLCLLVAAGCSVGVPFGLGGSIIAMQSAHMQGFVAAFWAVGVIAVTPPISFLAWPSVMLFWAVPLSSALFARASGEGGSWAFEPGAIGRLPTLRLHGARAAVLGLAGGFLTVIAVTWLQFQVPPSALVGSGLPATTFAVGMVSRMLAGVLLIGLIAMAVALTTPRLPIVHALCAGFVASLAVGAGEIIRMWLEGWHPPISFLFDVLLPHYVFDGALAALTGAVIARGIAATAGLFAPLRWPRFRPLPTGR
jgi:hypothetical protein